VALRAVTAPFYKANFETNPLTDGLTDRWTGDPNIDQNNRKTRGINSKEVFAHAEWVSTFADIGKLTMKPYIHTQEGNGWFYVPYKQLPSNGQVYSSVTTGATATPVVQECYANQYQRNTKGELIPVSAVTYPAGVTAASLKSAGCPAAAKYQMNAQSQWAAREASTRRSDNEINRKGLLAEFSSNLNDAHKIRVGTWFEQTSRKKYVIGLKPVILKRVLRLQSPACIR